LDKKGNEKNLKFVGIFIAVVLLLAGIRHIFDVEIPSYDNLNAENLLPTEFDGQDVLDKGNSDADKSAILSEEKFEQSSVENDTCRHRVTLKDFGGKEPDITKFDSVNKNTALYRLSGKIWNYDECFADTQQQHLFAAQKFGIRPVKTHSDVMQLAKRYEVVSIEGSPFYVVDKLKYSVPYLIPSAKELLTEISFNFLDSLQSKGYKMYLPIVSSVLRTTSDVEQLKKRNRNATDDSCHSYGTTFDITYSRFMPLTGIPTPVDSAEWRSSELKLTLAEVIYDLRDKGKCFVKHERRQPCFHITVRY